jgi:hypothetical protein
MGVEKVFYSEVSLESLIVEIVEVFLYTLRVTRLGEREVFVVGELAEVLAHYIFIVVNHSHNRLYFVRVDFFHICHRIATRNILLLLIRCCRASFFARF